jgi:hypothetical protein
LDAWHDQTSDVKTRQAVELSSGLIEILAPQLNWDGLDVERDETKLRAQLQSVMEKVRYRQTRYP